MTIRKILKMGDPRLLQKAQRVPDQLFGSAELALLIEDMLDTMHASEGVGLAAPQIGVDLQLVLFGVDQSDRYPDAPAVPRTVLLNPVITPLESTQDEGWEGCLSVPGMRGIVPRWSRIRYEGVDQFGVAIVREVDGFHARVVQHECDHLEGTLYPMRMLDLSRFGFSEVLFPDSELVD
jgi:peptide deformylase